MLPLLFLLIFFLVNFLFQQGGLAGLILGCDDPTYYPSQLLSAGLSFYICLFFFSSKGVGRSNLWV